MHDELLLRNCDQLFNSAEAWFGSFVPRHTVTSRGLASLFRYFPARGNYVRTTDCRVIVRNGRDWNLLDVSALAKLVAKAVRDRY